MTFNVFYNIFSYFDILEMFSYFQVKLFIKYYEF